jgi:arginine decarboxylase
MSTEGLLDTRVLAITVRSAVGRGPTSLAAFDAALASAGVANFNLIRLSSVIPPGSIVAAEPAAFVQTDESTSVRSAANVVDLRSAPSPADVTTTWGHRLYAVWAYQSAELLGEEAWAGVAWVQDASDGRGLFVEHEGGSESQVRDELAATLTSISATRGMSHLEQHSVVVGTRCEGEPVAALVIAPFSSEGWNVTAPWSPGSR